MTTTAEMIAQQKSYYNPEYETIPKEEYEKNIEKEFAEQLELEKNPLLDDAATNLINQHFPLDAFD